MGKKNDSKKELHVAIGTRIADARRKMNYTQENLASDIDVSTQYISNLERGVVGASVETLIKISKILCVSCDYILTGKEYRPPGSGSYIDLKTLSKKELDDISDALNLLMSSGNKLM